MNTIIIISISIFITLILILFIKRTINNEMNIDENLKIESDNLKIKLKLKSTYIYRDSIIISYIPVTYDDSTKLKSFLEKSTSELLIDGYKKTIAEVDDGSWGTPTTIGKVKIECYDAYDEKWETLELVICIDFEIYTHIDINNVYKKLLKEFKKYFSKLNQKLNALDEISKYAYKDLTLTIGG